MPIIDVTNDENLRKKAVERACETLRDSGLVGMPTETVYGLAADANNGVAVAEIFALKGRPQFNPLIAHVSGLEMAQQVGNFSPLALTLAKAFWPGPLTLVVPKKDNADIHDLASAGQTTIALRQPTGVGAELVEAYGAPLVAPSANISGHISPTSAAHVNAEFGDKLLILDAGKSVLGIESTIAEVDGDETVILRAGSITADMLEKATGKPVRVHAGGKIKAPGMMKSHYAPKAQVTLDCSTNSSGAALLAFGKPIAGEWHAIENLSPTGNLVEAASNLYGHLRKLDALQPHIICVMPVPEKGIGIAINDRLRRAAAPKP